LAADQALNLPDFRAAERTFQLLTQAAGRAGRSDLPSRIVLQTYAPEHPAVAFAKHHDYHGFAAAEMAQRQAFGYPPFAQLIKVLFAHSRAAIAEAEAQAFAASLAAEAAGAITLLGPAPAPIARLQSLYRFQLLIKTSDLGPLRPILRRLAQRTYPRLHRFSIDMDPYSML
jgi:primosomal protein N' (replication factor Y)